MADAPPIVDANTPPAAPPAAPAPGAAPQMGAGGLVQERWTTQDWISCGLLIVGTIALGLMAMYYRKNHGVLNDWADKANADLAIIKGKIAKLETRGKKQPTEPAAWGG